MKIPPIDPDDLPPLNLVALPQRNKQRRSNGTFDEGAQGHGPRFEEQEEVRVRILNFLRAGATRAISARAAGVSRHSMGEWVKKGKDGVEPYATFLDEMEQAEAFAEVRLVGLWSAAAVTNYQAARDLLKVRFRERWNVDVDTPPGVSEGEVPEPTTNLEQLSQVMAALEEAELRPADTGT